MNFEFFLSKNLREIFYSNHNEISFSELKSDYDNNSVKAEKEYNKNMYVFYVKVNNFDENGSINGTIYDSNMDTMSGYDTTISFWKNTFWGSDNVHARWDWSIKTTSSVAETMTVGETYKVKGLLKVNYSSGDGGVTSAKVTDISIIE